MYFSSCALRGPHTLARLHALSARIDELLLAAEESLAVAVYPLVPADFVPVAANELVWL